MVDQAVCGTNQAYLIDFIEIHFRVNLLNPVQIKHLYLEEGRSASQIAAHFLASKCLVVDKAELKVCRLIVELMGRRNLSGRETARELQRRGFKTRKGHRVWGQFTVRTIFNRWKDKL